MHPVILKEVNKTYHLDSVGVPALCDINLEIRSNRFTVISGPSGSGKTTLLNVIGCIDRPDRGEVLVAGQDVQKMSDNALSDFRAHQLGFIFQNFNLLQVLTAYENVEYPLLLLGRPAAERRAKVAEILERTGLAAFAARLPDALSGGQRQRVAIARALVKSPSLVIADEPTANLDSHTAQQIVDLLRELSHERGAALVVATHDERMSAHCDRVLRLADGEIVKGELQ